MTFKKGKSGNINGRPKGQRNKITLQMEKILQAESENLIKAAIDSAKEGDTGALKLCLDRIFPARKDATISLELPKIKGAEDLPKITEKILKAVSEGEISPSEGQALAGILEKHRAAVETADLQKQLNELKESLGV